MWREIFDALIGSVTVLGAAAVLYVVGIVYNLVLGDPPRYHTIASGMAGVCITVSAVAVSVGLFVVVSTVGYWIRLVLWK